MNHTLDIILAERPTTGLVTLQTGNGTLTEILGEQRRVYPVHLVRSVAGGGTPGRMLCGVPRFGPDAPGWSLRGGVTGPSIIHQPCLACENAALTSYPHLRASQGIGSAEMNAWLDARAETPTEETS